MDLGPLKDKKVQLAAGAGAVLALVTIIKKKSGGGVSGSSETSSTTGAAGSLGTFSDSGMSAYNNLNDELGAGLAGFTGQLTQIQDQLGQLTPPGGTSSGSGSTAHTPTATPSAHQQHVATVQHQQHVANTKKPTPTKPAAPKKPAPKKPAPKKR